MQLPHVLPHLYLVTHHLTLNIADLQAHGVCELADCVFLMQDTITQISISQVNVRVCVDGYVIVQLSHQLISSRLQFCLLYHSFRSYKEILQLQIQLTFRSTPRTKVGSLISHSYVANLTTGYAVHSTVQGLLFRVGVV